MVNRKKRQAGIYQDLYQRKALLKVKFPWLVWPWYLFGGWLLLVAFSLTGIGFLRIVFTSGGLTVMQELQRDWYGFFLIFLSWIVSINLLTATWSWVCYLLAWKISWQFKPTKHSVSFSQLTEEQLTYKGHQCYFRVDELQIEPTTTYRDYVVLLPVYRSATHRNWARRIILVYGTEEEMVALKATLRK